MAACQLTSTIYLKPSFLKATRMGWRNLFSHLTIGERRGGVGLRHVVGRLPESPSVPNGYLAGGTGVITSLQRSLP